MDLAAPAADSIEHGARQPRGRQKAWEPIRKRRDAPVPEAAPSDAPGVVVPEPRATKKRGEWKIPLLLGLGLGALLALLGSFYRQSEPLPVAYPARSLSEPQPDAIRPGPPVRIERTSVGVPCRIEGKTPRAVLDAFCAYLREASHTQLAAAMRLDPGAALTGDPFVPVEIRPTQPYQRNARLGVLRQSRHSREYAVWIRTNPPAKTWFAGNGADPLVLEPLSPREP